MRSRKKKGAGKSAGQGEEAIEGSRHGALGGSEAGQRPEQGGGPLASPEAADGDGEQHRQERERDQRHDGVEGQGRSDGGSGDREGGDVAAGDQKPEAALDERRDAAEPGPADVRPEAGERGSDAEGTEAGGKSDAGAEGHENARHGDHDADGSGRPVEAAEPGGGEPAGGETEKDQLPREPLQDDRTDHGVAAAAGGADGTERVSGDTAGRDQVHEAREVVLADGGAERHVDAEATGGEAPPERGADDLKLNEAETRAEQPEIGPRDEGKGLAGLDRADEKPEQKEAGGGPAETSDDGGKTRHQGFAAEIRAAGIVPEVAAPRQPRRRWWTLVLAVAAVLAALLLPDRLSGFTRAAFETAPLEAAGLVAILAAAGGWLAGPAALLAGLALALAVVLKIADAASHASIGRPFDPVLDFHLLASVENLLRGAIGSTGSIAAVAGAGLAVAALVVALVAAAARIGTALRSRGTATAGTVAAAAGAIVVAGAALGTPTVDWPSARLLAGHATGVVTSWRDLDAFRQEMAVDAAAGIPPERLLSGLAGKDVLVVFIESYGRSAVEDPRYAPEIRSVLADGTRAISQAGLSTRTGFLTSTTVGGMSWLAHGTLLSGLRIDSQRRYEALVASPRTSLNALFKRAGWRTVALAPAITMPWPESRWFGYDAVYPAADLGYRGKPFNWVTMPDQFVYAQLERLERTVPDRPRIMAELALVSSHAPWTPVAELVPWDEIGDGTIFNAQAVAGDPPDVVWRDPDRVRLQYRQTLEYALKALAAYAARHAGDDLVIIALGDHQPAPLVTGDDAGRDVPVHVIAKDPAVLKVFEGWGWTDGLVPGIGAPAFPMSDFRDRFVRDFSGG